MHIIAQQLNSVWEFSRIYHGRLKLSTFRKRQYKIISFTFLRNARLITSLFSMNLWLFLLAGIVLVKPSMITYWLMLNGFVMGTDLLSWIIEIFIKETALTFSTFMYQLLYMTTTLMVRFVRNTFQDAVDNQDTARLQLF